MFPHEPAAVSAGLVTDQGHSKHAEWPVRYTRRRLRWTATLRNLGSLAQAYKGGNTRVPSSTRDCCRSTRQRLTLAGEHPPFALLAHTVARSRATKNTCSAHCDSAPPRTPGKTNLSIHSPEPPQTPQAAIPSALKPHPLP